jgi:TPR repeat protein
MSTSERLQAILADFKKEQLPAIEQAAEAGDPEAALTLGVLYANGRGVKLDHARAADWLTRAADRGLAPAQTLLGWMYAGGHGVEASARGAAEWYLRAATQGDADAQVALADLMLSRPPGLAVDVTTTVRWYERAARLDHPKAQYQLGKLLAEGDLVAEDTDAAFQWLTLAILNGSEPAQRELSLLTARLGGARVEELKRRMTEQGTTTH